MKKHIDYFFTLNSPWCYLGTNRLMAIRDEYEATVSLKPVVIATLFEASGGVMLGNLPKPRQDYQLQDLRRWSRYLDIPLNTLPKYFPCNDLLAAATLIAAQEMDLDALELASLYGRNLWGEERDISDPELIQELLNQQAISPALFQQAKNGYYKDSIAANTQEAISLGIFGVPSYVLDDEIYWGQDRLDFVEMRLANG